jgi:hypothetical protein
VVGGSAGYRPPAGRNASEHGSAGQKPPHRSTS